MKKSLLAVAAMTAFAGAAQAQSNVTIYGILDVGYVGGNAKSSSYNTTSGAQTQPAETVNGFGQSAESTSRLGFKGSEDLGGGLSGIFTFETGLSPNSSTLSGFNNRQAFVGLKKSGLGMAAIGTQYTPIHTAVGKTSANQQNNVVGDIIYPQSSGLNASNSSNANQNNIGYTIRANNMLKLESDTFAGFKATAFYVANDKNENQATLSSSTTNVANRTGISGGTTNSNGYGLGVDYNWKKLLVSANYQSFKVEQPYSAYTNTAPVTGSAGTTAAIVAGNTLVATGTNTTDGQAYVGATYDFGMLKAYAQWINKKVTNNLDSNDYVKRTAQQIGVRSFLTPKIEAWASVGNGRWTANGGGEPTANISAYQLGANYWLSKRTNLYTIFGASQTSSTSQTVTTTSGSPFTRNISYNANNYAVGVRHTF